MDVMELVRSRRSVRTFEDKPLREEDAAAVLECAAAAENPYGIPIDWRLLDAGRDSLSAPVIAGAETYIAGKMRRVPHAEEAFGYSFERVVLYAADRGIGTTWIAGTMDRPAFERAVALEEGEVMPCVSPLGYPAKKMRLKETLMRTGIKADSRLDFSELFFDCSFDKSLSSAAAGMFSQPLEMVRWAPSAVNRQPWRVVVCGSVAHFYEKPGKGFAANDGWDIQKIDMGIAMYHFVLGVEAAGAKTAFLQDDPGLKAPEGFQYIASFQCS